MDHQTLAYHVGPHTFVIENHLSTDLSALLPSCQPFLTTNDTAAVRPVFSLLLATGDTAPQDSASFTPEDATLLTDFEWEDARCSIYRDADGSYTIELVPHGTTHSYCLHSSSDFGRNSLYLGDADERLWPFVLNNFLMMVYTFATAPLSTLLVHASVISCGGRAYMFLGRSGTGKSTHSRLWLEHIPGCRLLNDDNPVLHVGSDGVVTVYGSPWSGKTPCYLNEFYPLGAVVRLEQAPANQIVSLGSVHAFAALLPSCSCLKQHDAVHRGVLDAVTRLSTTVPVYHLKCLPDADAARLCSQTVGAVDSLPN